MLKLRKLKHGAKDVFVLYSAGADGEVKRWSVSDEELSDPKLTLLSVIVIPPLNPGPKPAIKALDTYPGSNIFVIGTDRHLPSCEAAGRGRTRVR